MMTVMEPKKMRTWSNVPSGTNKATTAAMAAPTFNTFRIARFSTFKLYHHPRN